MTHGGRKVRVVWRAAWLFVSLAASACFPVPPELPTAPRQLDARTLSGEWHVAATNFPMWLDGERCKPRFRYSEVSETRDGVRMDDEVAYVDMASGEAGGILGFDLQDPDQPAHFTWRGDGILGLFTSEWYVARLSDDGAWAIIYFTSTPATPEGVDVLIRGPEPAEATRRAALEALREDPFLREKSSGLQWILPAPPDAPAHCR
jgi:hypothetical protein